MESIFGAISRACLIGLLLAVNSCSTTKRTEQTSTLVSREAHYIRIQDTTLQGWNFRSTLNMTFIDSIAPGETRMIRDTTADGRLRGLLVIERDRLGRLRIQCQEQDETIRKLTERLSERDKSNDFERTEVKRRTNYFWVTVVAVSGLLVGAMLGYLISRFLA